MRATIFTMSTPTTTHPELPPGPNGRALTELKQHIDSLSPTPTAKPVDLLPIEINYHELPPESEEQILWENGRGITFPDGRTVVVYDSKQREGLAVKITRLIKAGKFSVLRFRLSNEAAHALMRIISLKLFGTDPAAELRETRAKLAGADRSRKEWETLAHQRTERLAISDSLCTQNLSRAETAEAKLAERDSAYIALREKLDDALLKFAKDLAERDADSRRLDWFMSGNCYWAEIQSEPFGAYICKGHGPIDVRAAIDAAMAREEAQIK
jgi:hypothetical protein